MNASFVDDERWDRISSRADALDDCNPLAIAWLNKLRSSASLCTRDDLYRANHAYLEASLVKVMYVVIVDAVLSFSLLY